MKNVASNRREFKTKWMCTLKIQLQKRERESIIVNRYRGKDFHEPKPLSCQIREP